MSKSRSRKGGAGGGRPAEIPMTDLGLNEEGEPEARPEEDRYAAGTPGGGTASGGLAGTNVGEGEPDNADLEAEMGSGVAETADDEADDAAAYGGPSGGAVGGSPAEGRATGGRTRGGITPGGVHRSDSTIGSKGRRGKKGRK